MTNEVKEILELYKNEDIEYYNLVSDLGYDKLLDYITKLQKRLDFMIDRNDEKQDKINKALDIIEQKRGEYDIPDELEKVLKGEK